MFLVVDDDGKREARRSFAAAEHLAKQWFADQSRPIEIKRDGELLAVIRCDGTGRVWCDLTVEGCKYA